MKTEYKNLCHVFGGAVCWGVLFMGFSASAQNLFVSNYTPGVIDEITPGGTVTSFVTGLSYPFGMAFNSAGNLFVADSDNDQGSGSIVEITPSGVKSTFASGLDPKGLAFDSTGDLFESDYKSGDIYEFTSTGTKSLFASGLNAPQALAIDSTGNLFVAAGYGNGNEYITKITPGGVQSTFASGLSGTAGLAFNNAGDLFDADTGSGNVLEFTPNGVESIFASGLSPNGPYGLAFDSTGNLYVGESTGNANSYITEITPAGVESTFATGLYQPNGLAFQGIVLPVPEPSSWALLAAGASALLFRYRRKI